MWSFIFLALLSYCVCCKADSHNRRAYVDESSLSDSYDFIVAGGGLAGLVVASRLSEDPGMTVLVLEAGDAGDAVPESINPPSGTYYESLVGTSYDWQYSTVPQTHASGRSIPWPRGKVLGGSSAVNGMYYVRPSAVEVDGWKSLVQSEDGSKNWGWNAFFSAMKKCETFFPPSSQIQAAGNIIYDDASYGKTGPIKVTYPGFMFGSVGNWMPSLQALGIPPATNPNGGDNSGGFVSTVSINPSNWTRSYSKSGYIDPLPPRQNLQILVSTTATRIIFNNTSSGGRVATAVEFARSSKTTSRRTVKVKKEVILTGGALGSPHILLVSGIGPKDVLQSAGVSVLIDLPGVGQHLQDHLSAPVVWKSLVQTAGDLHATGNALSKEPIVASFINSATAYINASTLSDNVSDLQRRIQAALQSSAGSLVPSQSSQVLEGYKAIYNLTQTFLSTGLGQVELLLSINAPGIIAIQAALQHPFSHGRVYINSSSIFDPLVVDPQYFSHFADIAILREGVKLARQVGATPPLNASLGNELSPGPDITSDQDIENWLMRVASTEYHPTATCAMLPESQGGVVNPNLQVYGLANVRVADASVFPLAFSSHLDAATYGLAEAAADIIKASHSFVNNSSSTNHASGSPSPTGAKRHGNAAASTRVICRRWAVSVVMFALVSVTY